MNPLSHTHGAAHRSGAHSLAATGPPPTAFTSDPDPPRWATRSTQAK